MYPSRHELNEIRRENLRQLVSQWGGPTLLAKKLGYANPSYLVQMVGPSPTRDVTEKTAAKVEEVLGLPPTSLSNPASVISSPPPAQVHVHGGSIATAIALIQKGCEDLGVKLTTNKFADTVAYVYSEIEDDGQAPSAEKIKQLINLAK